jgi:hypothetical protein
MDINTISSPVQVFTYNTPGTARGVDVSGNYAFVADQDQGLAVFDISDLTPPVPVQEVAAPSVSTALLQNDPNPFNPSTRIQYTLAEAAVVDISVYDLQGRRVAVLVHGRQPAGMHAATFSAAALPAGVYVCTMQAGKFTQSSKLVFAR